MVWRIINVNF